MRNMKKLFLMFACVFACIGITSAYADKPIQKEQLPQAAQQFIKTHFPKLKVSYVTMDKEMLDTTYDVMFTTGEKAEFDKAGKWKEVDCGKLAVPASIVPKPIMNYVKENHPGQMIVKIDRDKKGYDVKLTTGLELEFNANYDLTDVDH